MKYYDKLISNMCFLIICIIVGHAAMEAGFTMVGESGVSQEVVNAIIGTITCMAGGYLIVFSMLKTMMNCVRMFKNSKNQRVISN